MGVETAKKGQVKSMFNSTLIFEPAPDHFCLSEEDRAWLLQKGVTFSRKYDDAIDKLSSGQFVITGVVTEDRNLESDKFLRTSQRYIGSLPQWQFIVGSNPSMDLQLLAQELSIRNFWSNDEFRKTLGPWVLEQSKILNDKSDEADRSLRLGVALAQDKLSAIETILPELEKEAQYDFRISFNMGLYYEKKQRNETALKFYEQAVAINSKYVPAIYRLAQKKLETGEPDAALAFYEKIEFINPNNPDRKAMMAQAYSEKGEWDKAKELQERALQLEPDNALARELEVVFAFESGDTKKALASLAKCSKSNDYFIRKLNAEAVKLSQNQQAEAALELYEKAHNIAPDTMKFRISYNIALAYFRQGNLEKSQDYCTLASKECIDPRFDKIEKLQKALNEKVA